MSELQHMDHIEYFDFRFRTPDASGPVSVPVLNSGIPSCTTDGVLPEPVISVAKARARSEHRISPDVPMELQYLGHRGPFGF